MAYSFKLAGQDITSTVQWLPDPSGGSIPNAQPIQVDTTLGQGAGVGGESSGRAAQATFLTTLGPAASAVGAGTVVHTPTLVRQGEVIITDTTSGTIIFGGYAGKLDDATDKKQVYTQVSCYDYWQALARVNINQVFDGVTDVQAINTLITTYAPWVSLSQVPTFASGTLLGQVWRNKTLQWALQKIAKITGRQVWVNPQKQLMYVSPTDANGSPFSLSDTPDMVSTFPHVVDTFSVDDQSIINRVTFYGGKQPTPDFSNDVSTQANGTNKVFVTAYYMRKSTNGKVIVTVNSVSQVVGYALGTGSQNTLKSAGGSCDCLINPSARTITFDVAPPAGASVICTYRYQLPLIVQVTQPDSVTFFGGYYDGTISDETVVDSATAIQRCRVLLLEQAYGLTSLTVRCWKSGLQTGQQLKVVNTVKGINNTYIIQEIKATPVAPNTIEYELTLGAWNWNLVDILHLLSARTAGSLDDNEVETVQPTQVQVMTTVGVSVVLSPSTTNYTMGLFAPGLTAVAANGEQPAYPGFSSI